MAAVNSLQEKKLEFARKSRYTFRLGYRKLDEDDVFIRDLNTGNDNERPWLTADEFKQKYRMSREALLAIAERIKDDDLFRSKRGLKQTNPTHQLMVLLDYLGTAGSSANNPKQRAYFHVGNGSVNNSRKRARDAVIHSLGKDFYHWPDENERKNISNCYKMEFNLPNCVGVMDGTLFPLAFQPETEDAADYHGRKFQWSLTCLVVSDQKRRIRWYITGYPGSAHDNRMLRRSPLKVRKEEYFTVYQYIIGDTAFDPSENVVPAYKANPNKAEPDDPDERLLNKVISKPRVSSEHVNGMWKGRFPWLRLIPNRVRDKKSLTEVMKYIHCTVILHNFLIEFGDQHIKSWESEEDRLSDIAEPANDPTDDMPGEEHMLYRGVPAGAPKDWRRATVREYLREHHATFELERNARQDDSSDDEGEDLSAVATEFENYFSRLNNN
jgi:hypothetical protein